MRELYAQGDILFERVPDYISSTARRQEFDDGVVVVAEGELSGHRHVFEDNAILVRDPERGDAINPNLYIGHVIVGGAGARLKHDEHDPIDLPRGTYLVRRQREFELQEIQFVAD